MSEAAPEFNPNVEDEETEAEEAEQPEREEAPPAALDDKGKRALERMKRERDKARKDLADFRKQAAQGNPEQGEMEKLSKRVEELSGNLQRTSAVASLLEAGFNGTRAQAEKMIRLVDNFDDTEWVEEMKVDFPERFGRKRAAGEPRPFTGGGRDQTQGPKKSDDATHVDKLLQMGRRR